MGHPEQQEPTPEHGEGTPEQHRNVRRRWTVAGVTTAGAALACGAFLIAQTDGTSQESLPETGSIAAGSEQAPAPATAAGTAQALSTASSTQPNPASSSNAASTSGSATGAGAGEANGKPAPKARPEGDVRKEIDEARAKAKADGVDLMRPLSAKGDSGEADQAVSMWTESVKNGTVRVTTARHDLTDSSALVSVGDRGKSVGDGVMCSHKIRFTDDAPAIERPSLLTCWRTSSKRSVVTMMATPGGEPSAAANISIINREWAKLR